ncbi:type I restriction enzyme HsdR N-terminal domain-containing protein [Algoriphagus sp. H41]|uniref:Type I restriction enzyme HsdR N-terminal domain-containing protein n=1 Tax=Algoriphagus oliviformis TaxID=2811231 RepID=A0ABS3C989_9BACT|nr:type I restriction enzyme HsdR N-terminal domain-containing protein [Algoriphagus oliviformis]MBN7812169.1 type I restriction enzyme HsdR N-terminal domain-containing protein [Algoriphagus oliviformis]
MSRLQEKKVRLPGLNLPQFEPVLKQAEDKLWIYDSLRKKDLVLTPEEWVRQHWINFLIQHKDYPRGLFSLEKGLKYNRLDKRTDLIVFDRSGSPYLLVECKAPQVKIDEKTLRQAMVYNQQLNCPNLVLSNGLVHVFFRYSEPEQKFVQTREAPCPPKQ